MHLEEILRQCHFDLSSLSRPEYQRAGEDHPLYLLRVPATEALSQWEALRHLVSETGYWPVIGWDRFKKHPSEDDVVQDIIEEGLHVDVHQWLKQEETQTPIDEERERRYADDPGGSFNFHLHLRRFSYTPPPLAPIALVPTSHCWEVLAYLPVTQNEWDPPLAVQVAMTKYWSERWGAEVVECVSGAMEMRVLRPPTTMEEALGLAKEQYIYCPDLVDQVVGSVNTLAKVLLNSPVWYFWWD